MSLGAWSFLEEYPETDLKKFESIGDIFTHVSLALIVLGMIVFWMSFAGCLGALRENLCFLRLVNISAGISIAMFKSRVLQKSSNVPFSLSSTR